jgi:hypothetical protein
MAFEKLCESKMDILKKCQCAVCRDMDFNQKLSIKIIKMTTDPSNLVIKFSIHFHELVSA